LSERPGEFARRLDALLRNFSFAEGSILRIFHKSAVNVSNKVLFELLRHFKGRNKQQGRSVWIKGTRRPTTLPTLKPMDEELIEDIETTIWSIFNDKVAQLEPLGKVWIDEELKKIPIPSDMRSLSEGIQTFVRGQRNPIKADKKVLRCYVHWTEGHDLDLSVEFTNGNEHAVCAFHDLAPHLGVIHSGDVVPHTKGKWAEYVDIDLEKTPFNYALMSVRNYNDRRLSASNAVIGFMERDSQTHGTNWYPRTVTNAVKVTTNSKNIHFILIDLRTKEWILIDEDSNDGNVSTGHYIDDVVRRIAEPPKVSAYDILKMHAENRGQMIQEIEDADVVFEFKDFSITYEKLLDFMLF
jgi:hypothetical protein